MGRKFKYGVVKLFMYLVVVILVLYCINFLAKTVYISQLHYPEVTKLSDLLSEEEITKLQTCTEKHDISSPCFRELHETIKQKIKSALHVDYLDIRHARFSNNNNNDGQAFHKDVKPHYTFSGELPKVYTIVFYLDNSVICVGNKTIPCKPGDIVIFNALYLHRAGDISPYNNKNRRILQWFHCFFDKGEQERFYHKHTFCEHHESLYIVKYLYSIIDPKWWLEASNLVQLFSTTCDRTEKTFVTYINKKYYVDTIQNVKYYSNF